MKKMFCIFINLNNGMRFEKNIYIVKDELVKNRLLNVKENFRGCMVYLYGI